jgi:hypothetical protein
MKWLILDRGFIDGEAISRCKTQHHVEVLILIKQNMDLWTDAWALADQGQWELLPEPATVAPAPVPQRPEGIVRREAQRQKTLAQRRAQAPPAPPRPRQEVRAIEGFTSWSSASVPMEVVLIRTVGSTDPEEGWALLTTASGVPAARLVERYGLRPEIEERHRQLKCFYDLSDFRSRSFNAITAQMVFILLAYTLRQWQLWMLKQTVWAGLSPEELPQRLAIHAQWIVIYYQMAYVPLPLATFRELEQRMLAPVAPRRPRPP